MEFRPCIDIHNGQVKQIVGGSLKDRNDEAKENFVAKKGADYYAELYAAHHIKGGHIILLNPASSEYYEATRKHWRHIRRDCRSEAVFMRKMQQNILMPARPMLLSLLMYLRMAGLTWIIWRRYTGK